MDVAEKNQLVQNWRGRRYLACRAADDLLKVAEALGVDDGSELPPPNGLPTVTEAVKAELQNQITSALRLLLALNDGNVSPSRLNRF